MLAFELFFGRSIQRSGEVTEGAWDQFLDRAVTPNLPDGYTIFDARGAWLDPATHRSLREHTKVLLVALPNTPASTATIERIRQTYAQLFHQTLVGIMVTSACGAF